MVKRHVYSAIGFLCGFVAGVELSRLVFGFTFLALVGAVLGVIAALQFHTRAEQMRRAGR